MSDKEIGLDEHQPSIGTVHFIDGEDCMGNRQSYWRVSGQKGGKECTGFGVTRQQAVDDLRKKMGLEPIPVGKSALPGDFDAEACYRERDGFRQLTDYLAGLVLSGAFLPHEIVGSATLAGKRAEEKGES